jgi:teichuronic acid biosynthesis glycosyltransferase TuaG
MRSRQDFALWLDLLRDGRKAMGIMDVYTKYRLSPGSLSRNKWKAARQMWRVYREHEGFGLIRTASAFFRYAWNGARKYWCYRKG